MEWLQIGPGPAAHIKVRLEAAQTIPALLTPQLGFKVSQSISIVTSVLYAGHSIFHLLITHPYFDSIL